MSTGNIVERIGTTGGIIIGFQTRTGVRYYKYGVQAAVALSLGHDPAEFSGEEVSSEDVATARALSIGIIAVE